MRKKVSILALFTLFFIQISVCGVNAESSQKDAQKELKYEVTVTLKLIQVYVIDKKGNPVKDLAQTDFELYDNGKPVKITDFEKHILSVPEKKEQEIKPGVSVDTPSRMSRKYFLLFDFAFNSPGGILKAKKAALHFIDTQLHPSDEVGVLSYSVNRGLTLHEYLTSDHKKIREVVQGFGLKDYLGRAMGIERRYWGEMEETPVPVKEIELNKLIYEGQVMNLSSAIKDMARALRYIPGSKHIIYFSGGIANSMLYGDTRLIQSWPIDFGSAHLRTMYEVMSKELAASNSPVYPVNTEGLGRSVFRDRNDMGDLSLQQLAKLSGGKYFDNITEYDKVMEEIQNLTSAYYVLGYSIDEEWDGKYHKVKVKVKRKGCEVFGQGRYFNPKPFTEYTKTEKMLHLIDLALSEKPQFQEPLRFPLLVQPYSIEDKTNIVTLTKIPKEKIKDIVGGKIEIISLLFDKDDNIAEFLKKDFSTSGFIQDNIYYYSLCSLPPSDYNCRVVIRNLETGKGAVASSQITIPEGAESGFRLFPPLLCVPGKEALYLKGSSEKKKSEDIALNDIYPFSPSDYSPLIEELKQKTSKILAVVRCFASGIKEPEIRLSGNLIHISSGRETPLSLSVLSRHREQNIEVFAIEIVLGELNPGRYLLELSADEIKTNVKSHTSRIFIVK